MITVRVQNLVKSFGKGHAASNALRGLSLDVRSGEFIALQGASGSGKTTLLNLIAGFDSPDAGAITILNSDLGAMNDYDRTLFRRKHMGVVFQTLNLLPHLTARENIELQCMLSHSGDRDADRAVHLLDLAGLADRSGAFPSELSGGEQQRIAVLRALAHNPDILLLDEPTSCLDTDNAGNLLDLLNTLNTNHGTTMLIATHDLRVAERAHRRAVISDGVIPNECT